MGRFQGRNAGGRGQGRGRGTGTGSRGRGNQNANKNKVKAKKGLADHIYYVGSANQASDYVTITNFLINYIKRTYTKGEDIAGALETLEEVDFTSVAPVMKNSNITGTDADDILARDRENRQYEKEFEVEYAEYIRRKTKYQENRVSAEALLWNQCANVMKAKIKARPDYESAIKGNPVELLQAIKQHALSYESTQYRMKTICDAMKSLVNLKQKEDESAVDYMQRFKAARDVFISHAGKEFNFPKVVQESEEYKRYKDDLTSPIDALRKKAQDEVTEVIKSSSDEFYAYLYLENADRSRYGSLVTGLDSQFSLNHDQYPKTLIDAGNVVSRHKYDPEYKKKKKLKEEQRKKDKREDEETPSLTFAQMKSICYCCGEHHKLTDCTKKDTLPKDKWHINQAKEAKQYQAMVANIEATMNAGRSANGNDSSGQATVTSSLNETNPSGNEASWQFFSFASVVDDLKHKLILDSGSSIDLFCNEKMLQDIVPKDDSTSLTTNAGTLTAIQEGTLADYGKVPYHPKAVANIMSLAKLSDKYHVQYDNKKDDAFYVHTPRKTVRFTRDKSGLYAHQPSRSAATVHDTPATHTMTHLQTVDENMKFYTPREIKRAKQARELLSILGSPSVRDLKKALAMNAIANCPITTADVELAEAIFGPDLGTLKGKTTRKTPAPLVTDKISIPKELYERRDALELCIDIMFVNEMPFLSTISRAIYYRTAQSLPTRTHRDIYKALDEVIRIYEPAQFRISKLVCDGEFRPMFDPVKDELDVTMEYTPAEAHVPQAERNNRTLKERIRATFHRLPYKALPKIIMKILVQESARKLNYFPNPNGISKYYSPRQIIHRETLDYKAHCQYALGSYVQAHTEPTPSNTQAPRTIDAIYLRPVPHGHEVYDLSTQRMITRGSVTVLPITPTVIKAVEAIADSEKQKGLRIKTRKGVTIYDSSWTAGVDYDDDDNQNEDDSDSEDEDYEYESEEEDEESEDDDDQSQELGEILYEDEEETNPVREDVIEENDDDVDEEENDETDEQSQHQEVRRSSRAPAPRTMMEPTMTGQTHNERQMFQGLTVDESQATEYTKDVAQYAANFLVTYSLKQGLKKYQDKGYKSAKKEMQQLHDRRCWNPIDVSTLTPTEREKALESLIFLVEKKSGEIKARHCANGSKQRQWMSQEDVTSPTVMTDSVLLTATIEAEEGRDVATFDIPNAFIQTPVEEIDSDGDRIIMKIRGAMVDMLLDINPSEYQQYVYYERGQKILYVHILRAIYGMLISGILFYKKFRTSIEKIGYKVNPYDPCVANKTINNKQHTISWHVDDLKSSHVDSKVNDNFHKWLQLEYGKISEVSATRGKKHTYLGMTLDYTTPGEVKVDMIDYVEKMLEEFPMNLKGKVSSAANENLFRVDVGKRLDSLKGEVYHTFVAKSLFLTKRARPDILTTVAFLCTRVREPTTLDWTKLVRLMDFLCKTKKDCLTLRSDGRRIAKWSIDAAFAVHPDMKSHSGMTMTLGRGAISSMSKKQKLNTRSSTEAELVAVDDGLGPVLWCSNFLAAQDYKIKSHVILQDNESAIKLEVNGLKSVGQRSRHINIRYFFITDQVEKGKIEIKYCPTDDLEADYMTKPLQGTKNTKFRTSILNL